MTAATRTTCPYCGVGCGVLATADGPRVEIAGDPDHPANFGRLCSKGSALGETLGHETRLLHPEIGGRRVTWDVALDHVAAELARIGAAYGPDSIALYLSGQLLTEDYYVANKLAKGFIGTPHVDTNSRLCMASSVAGHRRAFGADVVPQCYDDVELADLVVLAGSNAAWCHPILHQRMQVARGERGMRIVNIDPRRTASSEGADLHLSIAPGTDVAFWNGLLVYLADNGCLDRRYIGNHTESFPEALAAARCCVPTLDAVAAATGLDPSDIARCYGWWAETPRVVSCYSQGVNQSAHGTDKVNAILNCHLATGRIGKPGSGPLSLTGQPNAMGGREVGGLANQLAAHMGFSAAERDRVQRFWNAPNLVAGEGRKAVEMFDAIAAGRIKALWVMGSNPAVSLPEADRIRDGLARLELFVISENVRENDTVACAHVRLPAAAWGEKDGTVTNSERRISRQRGFMVPAGEALPDWRILCEVARRLGWAEAFAYQGPAEIFREHARLSGFENEGDRAFDISGLADITDAQYAALAPVQWPVRSPAESTERMLGDGQYFTASRRARFVPVALPQARRGTRRFVLNTGRVRDQWHTMTRTGLSPRLSSHTAEPFVEIHPDDATGLGLAQGTLARIMTDHGAMILRVLVNPGQQPGSLFVPIHWSDHNSSGGRIGALVHPVVDPVSGQPASKATPASIVPVAAHRYGVILSRAPLDPGDALYWTRARFAYGHVLYFALAPGADRIALPAGEAVDVENARAGIFHSAVLRDGRLEAAMLMSTAATQPSHHWLESQFAREQVPAVKLRTMLAGRAIAGRADRGSIICVCFLVDRDSIVEAAAKGAASVEAIGKALGAGTNCGSCKPELAQIIAAQRAAAAE